MITACNSLRYISKNFDTDLVIDQNYSSKIPNFKEVKDIDSTGSFIIKSYDIKGNLTTIKRYSDSTFSILSGRSETYFENGSIKIIENFDSKGKRDGSLVTYYPNHKIKRNEVYKTGEFVNGKCFDSSGNETNYFPFETEPMMDLQNLSKCLVFPENLRRKNIEEIVVLKLLLDKEGNILKITYDNKHSKEFIEQAVACIQKEYFTPAIIDGEKIVTYIYVPIRFKLI